MARNVTLQHLRGVEANIPTLSVGEFYFATDTYNLWTGTAAGNIQIGAAAIPLQLDYASLLVQAQFDAGSSGFTVGGN